MHPMFEDEKMQDLFLVLEATDARAVPAVKLGMLYAYSSALRDCAAAQAVFQKTGDKAELRRLATQVEEAMSEI